MKKSTCREEFQEKRRQLSPKKLSQYSEQISELLFTHFQFNNKTISLFLPIERKREINTYIILDKAVSFDAKVTIPKVNFENNQMKHYLYEGPQQLELSKYDIPEPKGGKLISAQKIDFVIVPLLAFDTNGYRVGYGKGFYDRFLKQCNSTTQFIGLSLFDAVDRIDDVEPTDIPLHFCVTPNGLISFKH